MSCNYHVFIGPYLEVYNPIQTTIRKQLSCPRKGCSNHKKLVESSFCPKCGEKIRDIDVPSTGRKEFDMYQEFPKERLTLNFEGMPKECKDYMYFHSNMKDCGRTFTISTEIIPIAQDTPEKEMDEFATDFAEEILRIEQVFNKENVAIKWGAVTYWS